MRLIIEDEEGRKTVVPVSRDEISIGRQDGNTVRLAERNVSRKHALLFRQNGSVVIEDLNSFNGVRVNGDRIQGRSKVQEGDLIQIGDYDLAIEREADAEPPTKVPERRTEPTLAPVHAPGYDLLPEPSPDSLPPSEDDRDNRLQQTAVIRSPFGPEAGAAGSARELGAGEMPRLVLLNTHQPGREFTVDKSEITLGRDAEKADLAIDHRSVSKVHAKLFLGPDRVWHLTDLKSANGIKVNGEVYENAPLGSGDIISLGHVELRFVAPGERFSLGADVARGKHQRRLMAIGVGAVAAVVVVSIASYLLIRHPESSRGAPTEMADRQPPIQAHQQPALAPVPTVVANPPTTPIPPAPSAADTQAIADAARASAALNQAKVLAKAHKWDQADERLKDAEAVDSDDPAVQRLRHDIDAAKERESARTAVAAAAKPDHRKKPTPSATAGNPAEAAEADPAPTPASPKSDRKAKASSAYDEAIAMIGSGDFVSALGKLQRAIELDPNMADAQKGMGICYAHLKEPDKGAYHYEQYLKLKPQARDAGDVRRMLQDYYKSKGGE